MADLTDNQGILESIRTEHCARKGEDHGCVGRCTITPGGGIVLDCKLCGKAAESLKDMIPSRVVKRLTSFFHSIGINPESLSDTAWHAAAESWMYWEGVDDA